MDRAASTRSALPAVVARVADAAEVYVDGGLRSGLDVLTALALGARATFCGRLPLLSLAAGGSERVAASLDLLQAELVDALRLAGCSDLSDTPSLTDP